MMGGLRPTIGSVVRQRRLAQGMSLELLADRADCAKSYLSQIENGRRASPPSVPVLARIESALGLTTGMLVEMAAWERTPGPVRRHVEELESREKAMRYLVSIASQRGAGEPELGCAGELKPSGGDVSEILPQQVPLIRAGPHDSNMAASMSIMDTYVRSPELNDPDAFAIRVAGDSMSPEYREGEVVIFSPRRAPESGMDCLVWLSSDAQRPAPLFRRVVFEGVHHRLGVASEWIRLEPLNAAFAATEVRRTDVMGLYAAVAVMRVLRGKA